MKSYGIQDLASINLKPEDIKCITALSIEYFRNLGLSRFLTENTIPKINGDAAYYTPEKILNCKSRSDYER